MFVWRQRIDEDFIGFAPLVDTFIGNIDFIAIFMGIDATGMIATFSTASDDEGNASLMGFCIQSIQKAMVELWK